MGYKANANGIIHKDLILGGQKHKAVYAGDKLIWEKISTKRYYLNYIVWNMYEIPNETMIIVIDDKIGPFSEETLCIDGQVDYKKGINPRVYPLIMKSDNVFYGAMLQEEGNTQTGIVYTATNFFKLSNEGRLVSNNEKAYTFKNTGYKKAGVFGYYVLDGYYYFIIHYSQDGDYHTGVYTTYKFDDTGNFMGIVLSDSGGTDYLDKHVSSSSETGRIAGIPYSFGYYTYRLSIPEMTCINVDLGYNYAGYYDGEYLFGKVTEGYYSYTKIQLYSYDGINFNLRADFSDNPQVSRIDYYSSSRDKCISVYGQTIYLAFKENKKVKVICAEGITNLPAGKVIYEQSSKSENEGYMEFRGIYARQRKLYVFYHESEVPYIHGERTVIDVVELR